MVAQLLEVTVIVTILIAFCGVPVIVKLLTDVFDDFVCVKKAFPPASGLAETLISTPAEGSGSVTVTVRGKSGPGAGASRELTAGLLVKARPVSVQSPLPPPLLLQEELIPINKMRQAISERLFIKITVNMLRYAYRRLIIAGD